MQKFTLFAFIVLLGCMCNTLSCQSVYIAHTGTKYHNSNCHTLAKGNTAIDLSKALADGYTACKICKPMQAINKEANIKVSENKNQSNNQESNSSSSQCTAKTKSGSRCTRNTKSSNSMCWQHGGN